MTAPRTVARALAGVLLFLSTFVGVSEALPAAPAAAAYCPTAGGANVQVDFGDLGGGAQLRCGSSGTAEQAFRSAGFALEYDRSSGLLCRVANKPADGDCTDTNSYWALFVAEEDAWTYASMGVNAQPVDPGDSVALVWQSTDSTRRPSVAPAKSGAAEPSPKPTKKPTRRATAETAPKPSARPTVKRSATPAPSVSSIATPITSASATRSPSASPTLSTSPAGVPTATATESAAGASETSEEPADLDAAPVAATDDDGGLPGWVPPVLVVALLGAVGGITLVRRRGA